MSPFALFAQYVENRLPFSRKCWKQMVNALEDAVGDRAHDVMYSAPGSPSGQHDWHPEENHSEQRLHSRHEQQIALEREAGSILCYRWVGRSRRDHSSRVAVKRIPDLRGWIHARKNNAKFIKRGWDTIHFDAALRRDAEKGYEDVEGMVGVATAFGANNANAAIPYSPGSFDRKVWVEGWRSGVRDGFK